MPAASTPRPATLSTGHHVVWSRDAADRAGTDLVIVFHGYGSNEQRAARTFFPMLPERCTGLTVRGGFEIDASAAQGEGDPGAHGWFLLDLLLQSDFAEVLASAHRVFDVVDSPEVAQGGFRTVSVLGFSLVSVLLLYALQRLQHLLPLSLGMDPVSPDQAWNTAVSFTTNTNWQSYSGEQTMGILTQMAGLAVQNFVSAAAGIAVAIALIRGIAANRQPGLGSFWVDLTRGVIRLRAPARPGWRVADRRRA